MSSSAALALFAVSLGFSEARAADPRAALQAAMADDQAGRVGAAIQRLNSLLREKPAADIQGQARLELVRIYERRAAWWEAAEQLQQLRKLAPGDPEYAYQLGVVYRRLSKSAFERMQAVAPGSARVEQMFGEQYVVAGDTRKAIQAFERAVSADPGLAGSHLALSMIYLRDGKRDDALAEINRELRIAPASTVAAQVRQAILGTLR